MVHLHAINSVRLDIYPIIVWEHPLDLSSTGATQCLPHLLAACSCTTLCHEAECCYMKAMLSPTRAMTGPSVKVAISSRAIVSAFISLCRLPVSLVVIKMQAVMLIGFPRAR